MTNDEVINDYIDSMLAWNAAASTIDKRAILARAFLRDRPLEAIRKTDVIRFLARQTSPWTKVTYYTHLLSLFTWAHNEGLIGQNVVAQVPKPRKPKDRPRPITHKEMTSLLIKATPRVRGWLILARYAGLRASEIAAIRGQDLNDDTMFVRGKGNRLDELPTHPRINELRAVMPAHGYWYPTDSKLGHVLPATVSQTTRRLFRSLGIDGSIHRCRHLFGSDLLRSGVNLRVVQSLLRHSNVATTAAYTAVDEEERMAAILRIAA